MIRLMLLLGLTGLVGSSAYAQTPITKDVAGNTVVLQSGTIIIQAPTATPVTKEVGPTSKRQWFPLIHRMVDNNHPKNCGEYGCPNPLGCGNFHTDFRFVFGSCRQFFGTSGGTYDHSKYPPVRD